MYIYYHYTTYAYFCQYALGCDIIKEISEVNMENTEFDVFLWANEIDEIKNNVSAELFLFNKNYTPYKIKYSVNVHARSRALYHRGSR